jgi:hypothetical protein
MNPDSAVELSFPRQPYLSKHVAHMRTQTHDAQTANAFRGPSLDLPEHVVAGTESTAIARIPLLTGPARCSPRGPRARAGTGYLGARPAPCDLVLLLRNEGDSVDKMSRKTRLSYFSSAIRWAGTIITYGVPEVPEIHPKHLLRVFGQLKSHFAPSTSLISSGVRP